MQGDQIGVKPIDELPEEIQASIKGISTSTSDKGDMIFTNFTFQDKKGALDMLFRHKSLYNDKSVVTVKTIDDIILNGAKNEQ